MGGVRGKGGFRISFKFARRGGIKLPITMKGIEKAHNYGGVSRNIDEKELQRQHQ